MPFFLRGIKKNRWYRDDVSEYPWLKEGTAPGDSLLDVKTEKHTLSIWRLESQILLEESDKDPAVQRLIVALAATRDKPDDYEYLLVDVKQVEERNFKLVFALGNTPDNIVNTWHQDMVELSADRVAELANVFWTHGHVGRLFEGELIALLGKAIQNEELDKQKMKPEFLKKLSLKLGNT